VPEDELSQVVKHPVKAAAIAAIARAFTRVDEAWLRRGPFAEVQAFLSGLPRVGAWSTAFILFRGLGRMQELEIAEGPLLDCARQVYGPRVDIRRVAAGYGEHVGVWCLYLRTVGARIAAAA
jgi:DNA-3-methyladenine glycosylase II